MVPTKILGIRNKSAVVLDGFRIGLVVFSGIYLLGLSLMPRDILWLSPVPSWESDLVAWLREGCGWGRSVYSRQRWWRGRGIWMNDLATSLVSNGAMQSGLWLSGPHVLLDLTRSAVSLWITHDQCAIQAPLCSIFKWDLLQQRCFAHHESILPTIWLPNFFFFHIGVLGAKLNNMLQLTWSPVEADFIFFFFKQGHWIVFFFSIFIFIHLFGCARS